MAQHVRDNGEGQDADLKRVALHAEVQLVQGASGSFVQRHALAIVSVAAAISITLFVLSAMRACSLHARVVDNVVESAVVESSVAAEPVVLDWANLDTTNNRYAYVVDGQVQSQLGIDVSENQHAIDWNAVAADGIDFAMIRLGYRGASEAALYLDAYYRDNLIGAKLAGVECGIYFFSQARTVEEAVEEADYVLANLGGVSLEYPIAFDSEDALIAGVQSRTTGLGIEEMTAIADAFCDRVEQAGYRAMVYGNYYDIARYQHESMRGRGIWWAEYDAAAPSAQIDIAMWQYSNAGDIAGIDAAVDMNLDLTHIRG